LTRCPRCGAKSRSDISGVSIRSALFALKKIGVVTEAEHEALDKSWRKYKEARIGIQEVGFRCAFAQFAQNQLDRDPCPTDDRFFRHP